MKTPRAKIGKRLVSLLLTAVMLVTIWQVPVQAETAEQQTRAQGTSPANPVHHCTKKNDGSDYTDWSYVYFGSYPQTEVTGTALTSAITGASYDANGDAWINGTKYRRINKSDANGSSTSDGFFSWNGDNDYHYFKWERIRWRVLHLVKLRKEWKWWMPFVRIRLYRILTERWTRRISRSLRRLRLLIKEEGHPLADAPFVTFAMIYAQSIQNLTSRMPDFMIGMRYHAN